MAGQQVHNIDDPKHFVLYRYHPSLVAAAIFTVLFGLTTFFHVYQTIRLRSWFMIAFIIGGFFETVGYIGRILSSNDQWNLNPFIMQTLLLLLAPALFAASVYMILGRIILLTNGEPYALIRSSWLTKIFVTGDVLSFLMQGAGGGMMSSAKKDPSKIKLGERVIIIGLFAQIFFFGFFVVVAVSFQIRARQHLATLNSTLLPWKKFLNVLYVTSALILIRSVFRMIEYLQGNTGFLLRHEVFLYLFDALLMLAVMVVVNVVHPGAIAGLLKGKADRERFVELAESNVESKEAKSSTTVGSRSLA
ncbi:RTA1 like protein-domain-containing protein [Clohesyomyces aquaticus]|uniref:RTA1 like protein-domain-containing protein n=1 Tax=Clohesyomyces aquaticus TaxID=1231657 RepID=A0A1Y1Z8S4_9PLEO|nr:RTA1 like protein-domain-containing protein [Clohesyomyces aquaticus]